MLKINKIFYKKILFLVIVICLFCTDVQSWQTDNTYSTDPAIDNDPFAELDTENPHFTSEAVSDVMKIENPEPDLFIETVILKFLDAKSLMQAAVKMVSA